MIKCNYCDFECKDERVKKFVDHVRMKHKEKLEGQLGFRLADHGTCTTKIRPRRVIKKPAWFKPFG